MRKSHGEHFSTAVPQKADVVLNAANGSFVPIAAVSRCSNVGCRTQTLLDHLVGAREQRWGNFEAERLGGLEIDHELVFGGCLHRQIGWLLTL